MTWSPDEETLNLINHVALQNALEYEGKAAVGSVIGRIMGMREDLKQHGKSVTGLVAKSVADANTMAAQQGLDAVRAFSNGKHHLLEKRETKARREGLPDRKRREREGRVEVYPTQRPLSFMLVAWSSTAPIERCTRRIHPPV